MKEALQQIVDLLQPVAALADGTPFEHSEVIQRCVDASEIALEALLQPAQAPTGMLHIDRLDKWLDASLKERKSRRTWVGLAPEDRLCAKYMLDAPEGIEAVIDYITAKLKEKNYG
jgi:hypothetical protein